jgi:hypothetical protein
LTWKWNIPTTKVQKTRVFEKYFTWGVDANHNNNNRLDTIPYNGHLTKDMVWLHLGY